MPLLFSHPRKHRRMSSALAFFCCEKSSLSVRFNFFCRFRRTCAFALVVSLWRCHGSYRMPFGGFAWRKAVFDGTPHVESALPSSKKEHRKQRRAYAEARKVEKYEKSHRDSTHIATAAGRGFRYHRVCMGKIIFMGTIKPNCFNLIGNFSSFRSRCRVFGAVMHSR